MSFSNGLGELGLGELGLGEMGLGEMGGHPLNMLKADVIRRTVLHNSTVSGYSQDCTWNTMVISVGDE